MTAQSVFNSLLVPTDFSEASRAAFDWAHRAIGGEDAVIIVLHVIDESLVETIATYEFAPKAEVAERMKHHADQEMAGYEAAADPDVEIDTMVVEGRPFLEIIRKADDFAVDAIVMGGVGTGGQFEKLLFGSTAEKVLRGGRRPVIVLPHPERA